MSKLQKTNQQGITKPRCAEDRLHTNGAVKGCRTEKPKKEPGCDKQEENWRKVIGAHGMGDPIDRKPLAGPANVNVEGTVVGSVSTPTRL